MGYTGQTFNVYFFLVQVYIFDTNRVIQTQALKDIKLRKPVPEKKIFEEFLPYMGMAVTWIIYIHIGPPPPLPRNASYKIWLIMAMQAVLEMMFEYYRFIHVRGLSQKFHYTHCFATIKARQSLQHL